MFTRNSIVLNTQFRNNFSTFFDISNGHIVWIILLEYDHMDVYGYDMNTIIKSMLVTDVGDQMCWRQV